MKKFLLIVSIISSLSFFPFGQGKEQGAEPEIFGHGDVVQIGIVVRDIERTAKAYADFLGIEPPSWFLTDPLEKAHTVFKGKPTGAQAKLAFIQLKNIIIELIEPVGGPSTWQEFLETKGEGVHHIAFEIKGMEEKIGFLVEKNIGVLQSGDYEGGRYSYMDSFSRLGVLLELLENF